MREKADKPIFTFLFYSGCRPCEARSLRVKDVDLQNEVIIIRTHFSDNTVVINRKGKKAPPVVIPIHDDLKPILAERIKSQFLEAFVFTNPRTGRPYYRKTLNQIWEKIRNKLNLDKSIRLYDATRHSFASNLVNKNVSIANISKLLGHTNIKMTERYAHVEVNSLKREIRKLSILQMPTEKKNQQKENN